MLCTDWSLISTQWIFHRLKGKGKVEHPNNPQFLGEDFIRGLRAKLSIIRKSISIEGLKRGSSSRLMVVCFLTSDTKKSSETTMGTVKSTRVVVRAWFKFNLEIISWLLFAPTPDFGQRLAGAVGEPFIPVEEKSRRVRFNEWPPKETTQPLFRCYQVGKWVKKTVLENVFLFLGFSSWLDCGCVLGQRHMTCHGFFTIFKDTINSLKKWWKEVNITRHIYFEGNVSIFLISKLASRPMRDSKKSKSFLNPRQ